MAIKNAKYQVIEKDGQNIFHFETGSGVVRVVDSKGKDYGSLQELVFEGKEVVSGAVTDIKASGLYKVQNLTGLPEDFPADKKAILSVQAVGDPSNPELVFYTIIGENGEVYQSTSKSGKATAWSSGGTNLQDVLDSLNKVVGDMGKVNGGKAISETLTQLLKSASDLQTEVTTLTNNLKTHKHDGTYIRLNGQDTMVNPLKLGDAIPLAMITPQGEVRNVINYSTKNGVTIGDGKGKINLVSDGDVTINGKKVITVGSGGKGSGIDAEKLEGLTASAFAKVGEINVFTKSQTIIGNNSIELTGDSAAHGIIWKNTKGEERAGVKVGANNRLGFSTGGTEHVGISAQGNIETDRLIILTADSENAIQFRLDSNSQGMGIYRNQSSKYLGFYNWDRGQRLGYFSPDNDQLYLDKPINIQGRRLWLQGGTPSGSHSVGDIWIS